MSNDNAGTRDTSSQQSREQSMESRAKKQPERGDTPSQPSRESGTKKQPEHGDMSSQQSREGGAKKQPEHGDMPSQQSREGGAKKQPERGDMPSPQSSESGAKKQPERGGAPKRDDRSSPARDQHPKQPGGGSGGAGEKEAADRANLVEDEINEPEGSDEGETRWQRGTRSSDVRGRSAGRYQR